MKAIGELTHLGQVRKMRQVAQAALDAYGYPNARLKFIARSENTTFRVDVTDPAPAISADKSYVANRCLLRIHRPGYQTGEWINSELVWLAALRSETGIIVPEPVPTLKGELLVEVAVPGIPGNQYCSLLRWVRGRSIRQGLRLNHFKALGRLMAGLHQHAARWKPPAGFTRRRWNWEGLFGDHAGFNLAGSDVWDLLPQPCHAPFKKVANQVRQVMEALGEGADAFGLIHADLLQGNLLFVGGEARAIDFDDCGFGYWVYDFATSLCHWQEVEQWHKIREALLSGYAEIQALPEEQLAHLYLFMATRHVSEMLWAIDLAQIDPNFREHVDAWLRYTPRHVNRFLDGK